jgi:hypothetical protein
MSHWTGKWSHSDTKSWTVELKQKLNFTNDFDGTFWMDAMDFLTHFKGFSLCKFIPNDYQRQKIKGKWEKSKTGRYNFLSFDLKSEQDCKCFVTLHQPDKRLTQRKYQMLKVWVVPETLKDEFQMFDAIPIKFGPSTYFSTRDYSIEVDLKASIRRYKIIVMSLNNEIERFTLRVTTEHNVDISKSKSIQLHEKTYRSTWKYPNFGGCQNHPTFEENPYGQVRFNKKSKYMVILRSKKPETLVGIGYESASTDVVLNRLYEHQYHCVVAEFEVGEVNFIFSTFDPKVQDDFEVTILSRDESDLGEFGFQVEKKRKFLSGVFAVGLTMLCSVLYKYIKLK